MLNRAQAAELLDTAATAGAETRLSLLGRLLSELPPTLWPDFGRLALRVAQVPPGTARRREFIELIARLPILQKYSVLFEMARDATDPDDSTVMRVLLASLTRDGFPPPVHLLRIRDCGAPAAHPWVAIDYERVDEPTASPPLETSGPAVPPNAPRPAPAPPAPPTAPPPGRWPSAETPGSPPKTEPPSAPTTSPPAGEAVRRPRPAAEGADRPLSPAPGAPSPVAVPPPEKVPPPEEVSSAEEVSPREEVSPVEEVSPAEKTPPSPPAGRSPERARSRWSWREGKGERPAPSPETDFSFPRESSRASLSPRSSVHPRLDAPERAVPGSVFTVTAGLRADRDEALVGPYRVRLPEGEPTVELQVVFQFDPHAFLLVPGAPTTTPGSYTLLRTPEDPWPSVSVGFVGLTGPDLTAERRIDASFVRDGTLIGFASRAIVIGPPSPGLSVVRSDTDEPVGPTEPPRPAPRRPYRVRPPWAPDNLARTESRGEPAPALDLAPLLDDERPDLMIVVRRSADVSGNRLVFTAFSRHRQVDDQTEPRTRTIVGGTTPHELGAQVRAKVATTPGQLDLYAWLQGLGHRVYRSMPEPVRAALRATVALGSDEKPSTVLVLSDEPDIPWELAARPEGWVDGHESVFLGGHVAISRWLLADEPPPNPRPASTLGIDHTAVVTARYDGILGAGPLPHAELEASRLVTALEPAVVALRPLFTDVLNLIGGDPDVDLMHFALHGRFDPLGVTGGLLLPPDRPGHLPDILHENHIRGRRSPGQPFVYLNACQIGAGDGRLLGDYGGMAAAFLEAGAGAVVAPLWNIDDRTAAALAEEFYRHCLGVTFPGDVASARPEHRIGVAELLRRVRARYTERAVRHGTPGVDATLVAFQLFGHPRLHLRKGH